MLTTVVPTVNVLAITTLLVPVVKVNPAVPPKALPPLLNCIWVSKPAAVAEPEATVDQYMPPELLPVKTCPAVDIALLAVNVRIIALAVLIISI